MSSQLHHSIKRILARLSAIEQRQSRETLMIPRRRLIIGGEKTTTAAPATSVPECRFVKYTTGGTP